MPPSPPRGRGREVLASTLRRRTAPLLLVVLLGVAACTADGGSSGPGEATTDGGSAAQPPPDEPAVDTSPPADPGRPQDVVVGNRAEPGTWPVGSGGSVAFDLTEGGLVVAELQTAEGWTSVVEEQTASVVVVRFDGPDGAAARFSVGLDDGRLAVERRVQRRVAPSGRLELPSEGHLLLELDGELPRLAEVVPGEGWMLADQQRDGDRIGLELRRDGDGTGPHAAVDEPASIVVGVEAAGDLAIVTTRERWSAPTGRG